MCACACVCARERSIQHKRENQLLIVSCFPFGFVFVSLTASSYYLLLDASVDVATAVVRLVSLSFCSPLFFILAGFVRCECTACSSPFSCDSSSLSFSARSKCVFVRLYVCIHLLEHTDFSLFRTHTHSDTHARCHSHTLIYLVIMFVRSYVWSRASYVHMCGQCDCVRPCYGLRGSELTT